MGDFLSTMLGLPKLVQAENGTLCGDAGHLQRRRLCDSHQAVILPHGQDHQAGQGPELAGPQHPRHLPRVHCVQPQHQPVRLGHSRHGVPHHGLRYLQGGSQGRFMLMIMIRRFQLLEFKQYGQHSALKT